MTAFLAEQTQKLFRATLWQHTHQNFLFKSEAWGPWAIIKVKRSIQDEGKLPRYCYWFCCLSSCFDGWHIFIILIQNPIILVLFQKTKGRKLNFREVLNYAIIEMEYSMQTVCQQLLGFNYFLDAQLSNLGQQKYFNERKNGVQYSFWQEFLLIFWWNYILNMTEIFQLKIF